jgi:hypothetical protein
MKKIRQLLAYIKTISYLWGSTWFIKLKRIFAPTHAAVILFSEVNHVLTPLFWAHYPVQVPVTGLSKDNRPESGSKSATGVKKAKVCVMFWWRKIQTMSYRLTIWSVIPEWVTYAITRPVPDRDAKLHLEVKTGFSLFLISHYTVISPDKTCHI